jgi:colanic acid/amylovoran biosynthesis protein WcaK/AmsJ
MGESDNAISVSLVGAAPTTGNLGVTALCYSVLDALYDRLPELRMTVFDYGHGSGRLMEYDSHEIQLRGATLSRRVYKQESLWTMRLATSLGGRWNRSVKSLRESSAIIDMSGGDSFTDLYGPKIFRAMTMRKQIAIESGTPLILGPQTYGPFRSDKTRRIASKIVRASRMSWARDADSFAVLRELLGDEFDTERHRQGVDCAFLLPIREPVNHTDENWYEWIATDTQDRDTPIVGLNVSGLLANDSESAHKQYGFKACYPDIIQGLLEHLLEHTDARVLLVPHVEPSGKDPESDVLACERVMAQIDSRHQARVIAVPAMRDPRQSKWIISRCDWFCGTRMHSAIAGLSTGVPTTAIAYSPKTRGVFATCGVADAVVDPRSMDTQDVLEGLKNWWNRRETLTSTLRAGLSGVLHTASAQMDAIAEMCHR